MSRPAIARLSVRNFLQFLASDLPQSTRAENPGGASAPCRWSVSNALGTQSRRARPGLGGAQVPVLGARAAWLGSLAPQGPSGTPHGRQRSPQLWSLRHLHLLCFREESDAARSLHKRSSPRRKRKKVTGAWKVKHSS